MKSLLIILLACAASSLAYGGGTGSLTVQGYSVTLDLAGSQNDLVKVTVVPPQISGSECTYIMPRSVPGTYSKDDYGRFVMNPKAYSSTGAELPVRRDDNDIVITGTPVKIEYWVRDTWDDADGADVFQPTGSNIQQDTNFLINTHCFIGYFDGYKMLPYTITVNKPKGFYGATSLIRQSENATSDVFTAKNYPQLVDNPMMYCIPDTTSFVERGTKVMVAIYSHNKRMTSANVARDLKPVCAALGKFFGTMPVDRYTFIIYFAGSNQTNIMSRMAFGALEHSYSSCYFLPESRKSDEPNEMIRSTAAHEFLHILVPLNLHSKEIHDFDFKNPVMSQHLWLYEGCTEYFSMLARAQDNTMTEKEFFGEMKQKMTMGSMMMRGNPLSLVELSKKVLEPSYQKIYPVIYEKGAVTAFFLDLHIRELTQHKLDLLGLIRTLTDKYGPDKPFDDDALFGEIERIVPGVTPFFTKYIIGSDALPSTDLFAKVGYSYADSLSKKGHTFSNANFFFYNDIENAVVMKTRRTNEFGIQDGDTLVRINDILATPENKVELMSRFIWAPKSGDTVRVLVKRGNEELTLKSAPQEKLLTVRNVIEKVESPTSEQQMFLRKLFRKD
ncbi:MAG: hypothetical protein JNL32_06170 [Candidatus Kapabacteria bacterium]|nr:hypothetical protein [Candidatus Kapabacteria bacterium]